MIKRALASLAALLMVAACATPFQARVSRFQQMPAPSGESFRIEPADPHKAGSLEFASYAKQVEQRLSAQGYAQAAEGAKPTLTVKLDYGVSDGREKVVSRPGFVSNRFAYGSYGPYGYWPYYRGYYGSPYWGSFYDPFWGSPWDYPEVYSYTVYKSFLDMEIRRTDGAPVFEGRAEADSREDDLTKLVPNLVAAMFDNFPGRSGETVKVKVPAPQK